MMITPGNRVGTARIMWPASWSGLLLEQTTEVLTIRAGLHRVREPGEIAPTDVVHAKGDLLDARHHQALAFFNRVNIVGGLHERFMGARVEPGDAAGELLDVELAAPEIRTVDVGNLQLAAPRRGEPGGDIQHLVVVEIQTGDGVRRFRPGRLLLETYRPAAGVELDDTVALRIPNLVPEHRCTMLAGRGAAQIIGEMRAIKNVVAKRERHPVAAYKLTADDECLREALGQGLFGVRDAETDPGCVSQQPPKPVLLVRRGDDEDLADTREHQGRQRVVHHRLVVDGQQLLADSARKRMQRGAGPAGQDDPLHVSSPGRDARDRTVPPAPARTSSGDRGTTARSRAVRRR